MSQNLDEIDLRSEEVQEILSASPPWLTRSGATIIFLLTLLLITISWFIKYPDLIQGQIILTTQKPPIKIATNSAGKLIRLYVKEGDSIESQSIIAEVENPLSHDAVQYLEAILKEVNSFLTNPYKPLDFGKDDEYVFGNIQPTYNELKLICSNFYKLVTDPYQKQQIEILKRKTVQYQRLAKITENQIEIAKAELKNAEQKYIIDKTLLQDGVISKIAFYKEESLFRQKQQNLANLRSSATQSQITLSDLEKQLLDLEYNYQEKKRELRENLILNLDKIRNNIKSWEQNYLIIAPISGKLSFLKPINENQLLSAREFIFAIIPENDSYLGIMNVPPQGIGKVKKGQDVKIKFDNYPSEEYGQVNGTVKLISQLLEVNSNLESNYYRVEIYLKDGLQSSYNKTLDFKPEMPGTAEIITEDLRLIERVFYKFRELFKR